MRFITRGHTWDERVFFHIITPNYCIYSIGHVPRARHLPSCELTFGLCICQRKPSTLLSRPLFCGTRSRFQKCDIMAPLCNLAAPGAAESHSLQVTLSPSSSEEIFIFMPSRNAVVRHLRRIITARVYTVISIIGKLRTSTSVDLPPRGLRK
jgi:hypothetical protein